MEGMYGKGKYCPSGPDSCKTLDDLEELMRTNRDARQLLDAWTGWHAISRPMRKDFVRYVELANKGAKQLGFQDNGAMWRSKYDMEPDAFAKELDRLWDQVRPLYVLSTPTYVPGCTRSTAIVVPAGGPLPAYLFGNMWAQEWGNVYSLVAPANADPGYDLTDLLKKRNTDWKQMVRYGEGFFTSLGFPPLPASFWDRSLFLRPRDRDVVCHASAWDVDYAEDLRLKMCIQITGEDFLTVHHELGHNFYQRAYNQQPPMFRDSANDGFHEAIGDTIALSVTPEYLVKLGLLDKAPDASKDIGLLLARARKGRLPALWPSDRSMAMEGILRRNPAREVQRNLVAIALEVSGDRAAAGPFRSRFRSRREISRGRERPLRALFPGRYSPVPVPSRSLASRGLHNGAQPLFDLWQRPGRRKAEGDARDGPKPPLAGRPGKDRGHAPNGRIRHSRLFRAVAEMARRAESR